MFSIITLIILIILLPRCISKDHWMRYYSCYSSYLLMAITSSMLTLPICLFFPSKSYVIPHFCADLLSKILGIEWEIRNNNKLRKYKKSVIVINHQSAFDFLGAITVCRPVTEYGGVFKKEIVYIFPFGPILKLFGGLFIDRKNTQIAMIKIKEHFKSQGKNIVIFPEGTRNQINAPFLPFKKGAFRLAVEFQVPIVPVVISPYNFIKHGESFPGGKAIISVMDPIVTTGLQQEDVEDLTKNIRELMQQEYVNLEKDLPFIQ